MFTHRNANLAGFLICAVMMMYALYAQEFLNLPPCPLCVFQRVAVIAMGVVFLIAALHNPGRPGRRIYAAAIVAAGLAGSGVAARHIWLQNLPPDQVPACGPGLDFMLDTFPLADVFAMVFTGSGECAEISWVFLGLSMPAWVLIGLLGLSIWAIWGNLAHLR
jgi:disulfide bond formation protein DsbB